mgnify:CR=1 FL=1
MKTRFFALAMLALALVACNNDNENLNGDPVAAQFTADIALRSAKADSDPRADSCPYAGTHSSADGRTCPSAGQHELWCCAL